MSKIWTNSYTITWWCRKHCGNRRNCLLLAISPFPTMFSNTVCCWCIKMSIDGVRFKYVLNCEFNLNILAKMTWFAFINLSVYLQSEQNLSQYFILNHVTFIEHHWQENCFVIKDKEWKIGLKPWLLILITWPWWLLVLPLGPGNRS